MPTGYTAKIADGISFKEFTLQCARAFGACIELRDEPDSTPIPDEFKPSDHNLRQLNEDNAKLEKLKAMSPEECEKAAAKEYADSATYHYASIQKDDALRLKYEAMLAEVEAWKPPTPDHHGIKKFMREQIAESIRFDCDTSYHQNALKDLKLKTGDQWKTEQIDMTLQAIARHSEEQKKENERAASRTKWINDLRNSL